MKWRLSRHGGKIWAKPLLLEWEVRSNRAREAFLRGGQRPTTEDPRKTALVIMRGALGADPESLMTALMDAIATTTSLLLARGPDRGQLLAGQWSPLRDAAERWNGNIKVSLVNEEDLLTLHRRIHGAPFSLHGEMRSLEVHNAFVSMAHELIEPRQGNGRGATQNGRPPPQSSQAAGQR